MLRHPRYLEIPWNVHWHQAGRMPRRQFGLLVVLLSLLALFLIGVGVTNGIM